MIEATAWFAGILALLIGIPASYLITLRLAKPHSKKFEVEQTQSSKKNGTSEASAATPQKELKKEKGGERWFTKYLWTILLVLAGVGILWKLFTPGLRFSQLGNWSWDNWLWLLVLWGIVFALIALNAKALGEAAKTLQKIAAFALFLMFLGVPGALAVRDAFLPARICSNGSANEIRSCNLNTAWSYWIEPEAGTPNGLLLCFDGAVESDSAVVNSRSVYRFRAREGEAEASYKFKKSCVRPL